jgi:hypothetical protein
LVENKPEIASSCCTKYSDEPVSPTIAKFISPIDEYCKRMYDGDKPYEPEDWRELLVSGRSIADDF